MSLLLDVHLASLSDHELREFRRREHLQATLAPLKVQMAAPPSPVVGVRQTPVAPPTAAAAPAAPVIASTPAAWRAEWSASPALQAEFSSVEAYVALRAGEAAGRVHVIAQQPIALSSANTAEGWRAEWLASAALQAEFASVDDYVALCKAEKSGRVKLWK